MCFYSRVKITYHAVNVREWMMKVADCNYLLPLVCRRVYM